MSFLSPLFLAGALAAAIPIVLHLLKREPEARVRFAPVKLLTHAPIEHTARRRLRELLLLSLRVAALVLLALAFARPFVASGDVPSGGSVTIVALDVSVSVSAPQQFARVRQRARDALDQVPSGDLVGVLTFADTPRVAARPVLDRGIAAAAIAAAAPGFGATRYRGALRAASELMDGRGGTIIVVTDLQESGWTEGDGVPLPEGVRVQVMDVGAAPDNLAVTGARADAGGTIVTVRNNSASARAARVTLTVDGKLSGAASIQIAPNGSADAPLPIARGTVAEISLDDPEGVQADNAWYLVLENAASPTVLVVTASGHLERDAFYLGHALLAAQRRGPGYQAEAVSGGALSSWDQGRLNRFAVLVLLSTRGLDRRGRELIATYGRNGGGVFIPAGADVDGEIAVGAAGAAFVVTPPPAAGRDVDRRLVPADGRHPVFRIFEGGAASLALVTFRRVASITSDTCATLARFTTGEAALVECEAGAGRVLVLASDVANEWNDFPRHAAFVPFVHEMVGYLAGRRARRSEYLVADVPPGVAAQPGFAVVDGERGGVSRRIAVNVDPAEAETGRLTPDGFQAPITRLKGVAGQNVPVQARQQEDRQRLWQYLLALMIAMLAVESFVGARTA